MISRRRALQLLGGASLGISGLSSAGCTITKGTPPISEVGLDKKPASGRKTNITMYSLWGGPTGQGVVKLAEAFEASHPHIGVRVVFAPAGVGGGSVQQKLMVAIAGNNPPDVAQLVPMQTAQWSDLGMMLDLTDRFKGDGLKIDDFFGPAQESMLYKDKIWQVQWDADPNFPFFWNKDLFEKVGLDPDKQPETVEEVDEFSKKLLKKSGANIVQIGTVPWDYYGYANSMATWGFAFGGSFYDKEKDLATPDDENIVRALEWIVKYAKTAGGAERLAVSPPGLTLHPFSTGHIGMSPLVSANYKDIRTNLPKMKIGAGELPYSKPAKGIGSGAWFGGWAMFIPRGARNPDAAWEFIKWVSTTPQGTKAQWDTVGFPPAYKSSPVVEIMRKDPIWRPYHKVLTTTTNARPTMSVSDYYFQTLDAMTSAAVLGQMKPLDALRQTRDLVRAEAERFKKEVVA